MVILRYGDGQMQRARRAAPKTGDLLLSFPVQIVKMLGLFVAPPGGVRMFRETMIPMHMASIGETIGQVSRNFVCESPEEILQELRKLGFERESLPECIGGTWSLDKTKDKDEITKAKHIGYYIINEKDEYSTEHALRELHVAIALAPYEDKIAYLEALEKCPELIRTESDPIMFLRRDNFDPNAATRRLFMYWTVRKENFLDKAFCPLTLGPEGAMCREDIDLLETGFLCILPPTRDGTSVLCVDYSRLQGLEGLPSTESRMRISFFLIKHMSANIKSQTEGIVVLFRLNVMPKVSPAPFNLMQKIFPVWTKAFYVANSPDEVDATSFVATLLPRVVSFLGSWWNSDVAVPVFGSNRAEIATKLEVSGFERQHIPDTVGGTWVYKEFMDFLRANGNVEKVHPVQIEETRLSFSVQGLSSEMLETGLAELEKAIFALPENDKGALLEARRTVPDLAEREAPPVRFLCFENYNPQAAARRLAAYWRMRSSIFGERALFPMDQSGEGTLSRDEVKIMTSGPLVILPFDSEGRSVVCYDSSRICDDSRDARLRSAFYIWSVVSENERTQQDGCKCLMILREACQDSAVKECFILVRRVLPVRFECINMVNCPTESKEQVFSSSFVPIMKKLMGRFAQQATVTFCKTKQELAQKLISEHEFSTEGLPKNVGGLWNYEQFSTWQEIRLRYEWELPAVRISGLTFPHVPDYEVKARSELTTKEQDERKRRLNVINSRRKRGRVRFQASELKDQVADLHSQNETLSGEN
jgi:hypothetical protein